MAHEFDKKVYDIMKQTLDQIDYYLSLNEKGVIPQDGAHNIIRARMDSYKTNFKKEMNKWMEDEENEKNNKSL